MSTTCEYCNHRFTNVLLRRTCPRCGQSLKRPAETYTSSSSPASQDEGFDATGFAIGMMTGVPLSPTRGVSTGALIGSMLHQNPSHASPAPDPSPSPSYSPPEPSSSHDSSSSYDSGSSSSSSYDSGSSSSSSGSDSGSW